MNLALKILEIISPVFILLITGYICKLLKILTVDSSKEINKFIFYISLPSFLASKIAISKVNFSNHWLAYISILGATLICGLIGAYLSNFFGMKEQQKWVSAHGCTRSNMAFIGLPIVKFASSEATLDVAILLMGMTIPIYNILGVIFLTLGKNNEDVKLSKIIKDILISIVKNPLIIGCIVGGILYTTKLNSGNYVIKNLDYIGSISIHLSLICLGVQMNINITRARIKRVIFPVLIKLFFYPAIGVLLLFFLQGNPEPSSILAIVVLLGCPSAVASYVMAVEMKADHEFAGDLVLATTLFSFFSLFILLTMYFFYYPTAVV